jgi:hypothetical protein
MAQRRFGVGLMAAFLKFKMAADRGRFLSGTRPELNQYPKKYLCAKFGAFIPICTMKGIGNNHERSLKHVIFYNKEKEIINFLSLFITGVTGLIGRRSLLKDVKGFPGAWPLFTHLD